MAIVRLTPQDITASGVAPTYSGSLSTGDTYVVTNNGRVVLHFKKTGAGVCSVTLIAATTYRGQIVQNTTATVPATTGDRMISLGDIGLFNDSNGDVSFTLNEVTGLTVAVVRLPW